MRGRQPQSTEMAGLKVTAQPLPFPAAQPLIPEVATILSIAVRELGAAVVGGLRTTDDAFKLAPALHGLSSHLEGRLEKLAPKILACTTVVMPDMTGDLANYDLSKDKDRNLVFDEYPEIYIPLLLFAGKVTFARFFPGNVLRPSSVQPVA